MLPPVFGVLFDGIAYGMLLFLLSVGLSVTLGPDEFRQSGPLRLRHARRLRHRHLDEQLRLAVLRHAAGGLPGRGLVSVVFERMLYRRLYRASDLDQVLLTIGLAFISVAVAAWFFGTTQQPIHVPAYLRGSFDVLGLNIAAYRLFLVGVGIAITLAAGRRARIHPLRRAGARGGRQPAHGERARHQCRAHLRHHLRARLRARRPRRRAGHRDRRARSKLRLHLSRLCADRRLGRRARLDRRLASPPPA